MTIEVHKDDLAATTITKTRRARAPRRDNSDYRAPSADVLQERRRSELSALLARPEVRSALHHCEHMQLVHDSFVRKLAGGSQVVTAKNLDDQLQRLADSRRKIFDLAQQHPLLIGLPNVPTTRP